MTYWRIFLWWAVDTAFRRATIVFGLIAAIAVLGHWLESPATAWFAYVAYLAVALVALAIRSLINRHGPVRWGPQSWLEVLVMNLTSAFFWPIALPMLDANFTAERRTTLVEEVTLALERARRRNKIFDFGLE